MITEIVLISLGGFFIILGYMFNSLKEVKPRKFVLSQRLIDLYAKKKIPKERILKGVQIQGTFFYILAAVLLYIGISNLYINKDIG